MRLFLAIDIPDIVKRKIDNQLAEIKKDYPQFSWTARNNFHITLRFYGERNNPYTIIKELSQLTFDQPAFYLYSAGVDLFINHKIVIYLTFHKEKKLITLEKKIRDSTVNNNTKKFIPHLSLARYRIPSKQQYLLIKKKLSRLHINTSFLVSELVLFESILGGRQPVYRQIHRFSLVDGH